MHSFSLLHDVGPEADSPETTELPAELAPDGRRGFLLKVWSEFSNTAASKMKARSSAILHFSARCRNKGRLQLRRRLEISKLARCFF